ncbi:MAG: hypothetical protein JXR63_05650 [Spirochaetales bacterium]|nr:hypothetical protein [Spirochaetales bacterium]
MKNNKVFLSFFISLFFFSCSDLYRLEQNYPPVLNEEARSMDLPLGFAEIIFMEETYRVAITELDIVVDPIEDDTGYIFLLEINSKGIKFSDDIVLKGSVAFRKVYGWIAFLRPCSAGLSGAQAYWGIDLYQGEDKFEIWYPSPNSEDMWGAVSEIENRIIKFIYKKKDLIAPWGYTNTDFELRIHSHYLLEFLE